MTEVVVARIRIPLEVGETEEDADERVVAERSIEVVGRAKTEAPQPAQLALSEAVAVRRVAGRGEVLELVGQGFLD